MQEAISDPQQAGTVAFILLDSCLRPLNCPDGLESCFLQLGQLLHLATSSDPGVGADVLSVIGLFARRCHVVFSSLPFEVRRYFTRL